MPLTRKIPCKIQTITRHSDDVFSLILEPEKPLPKYRSGQFLHLAIDDYDPSGFWPESRVFSIASSSNDLSTLEISYSIKGKFTARMAKELFEGAHVWVKLPYGEFIIQDGQNAVLIAGGTGITAFTAFIKSMTEDNTDDVQLFYGAREVSLLIYDEMILAVEDLVPAFSTHFYLENLISPKEINDRVYFPGRLSVDVILSRLSIPSRYIYYLSGPPEMLKLFSKQLIDRGIDKANVRIDAWE